MDYKVGDIIITGTDSSPVISEIVEQLESLVEVKNVIYSIHGERWEKMNNGRKMYERISDIRRLADSNEIDTFLEFYGDRG